MGAADCKDLMIGDFIHVKGERELSWRWEKVNLDADCVVTAVYKDGTLGIKWYADGREWISTTCNSDEIAPIPLTCKILKKNGFVRKEEYEKYEWCEGYVEVWVIFDDEQNVIHVEDERNSIPVSYHNTITFVHELQHALRLCNIDKEVKL